MAVNAEVRFLAVRNIRLCANPPLAHRAGPSTTHIAMQGPTLFSEGHIGRGIAISKVNPPHCALSLIKNSATTAMISEAKGTYRMIMNVELCRLA